MKLAQKEKELLKKNMEDFVRKPASNGAVIICQKRLKNMLNDLDGLGKNELEWLKKIGMMEEK